EPGDTVEKKSRIEIPLAETSGKWLGRGMGEIWEHRMPITRDDQPMIFPKPGTYEIRFEQNMRMNPLPEILDVGLRVSKVGYTINKLAYALIHHLISATAALHHSSSVILGV